MIEQWFLDLDGVRSGPYQTPEVMSLVAEGEVLPHHRISTGLSSQNWITILDWRLDQAKVSQKPKSVAEYTARSEISPVDFEEAIKTRDDLKTLPESELSHFTEQRAELEIAEEVEEEVEEKVQPKPQAAAAPLPKSAPQKPSPKPTSAAILADLEKLEPTLSDLKKELEKSIPKELPRSAKGSGNTAFIKRPGAMTVKEPAPAPPAEPVEAPSAPRDPSQPRRDPMAEMFDVLQKTKQKREAKQNSSAANGISIEQDVGAPIKGFNLGRTLMIGGGITLIGFALGQVFQQQAVPVHETNLPSAPPKSVGTPLPKSNTQVIDRSTEKMTIRGTVERKPDPTPAKPQAKPSAPANNARNDSPQTEKELEELRNLKKELQELKNLKTNAAEEQPVVEPEGDGFDAVDQPGNAAGNTNSGTDAQGSQGANPNEPGQPSR